jgi:hypothetical protein|tara:strand:- start:520 stop:669 length:150 start_codon:yes stop_codon:yes gene_type:complete
MDDGTRSLNITEKPWGVEVSIAGTDDSVRLEDDYRRITDIPAPGPQSDK